jgi:hypothetical protein
VNLDALGPVRRDVYDLVHVETAAYDLDELRRWTGIHLRLRWGLDEGLIVNPFH